jgi:hypothetical protein
MAREISRIIVKAINDQRYSSRWKPLTHEYLEYKKKSGLSTKIWEASSKLKLSVGYDIESESVVVGVNDSTYYENGQSVLEVSRWMEYGTRRMPSRPLFRPVIRYVRSNISYFYKRYTEDSEFKKKSLDSLNWTHRDLMKLVDKYSLSRRS